MSRYLPDRIVVSAGQPVRLNFFRKDPSSCLEKVLFPDFHKAANLRLNQTTSVEFTPENLRFLTLTLNLILPDHTFVSQPGSIPRPD